MSDVITNLESVDSFVMSVHPDSQTYLQNLPESYGPNTFLIRFLGDSRETETLAHYRKDIEYDVVYIGSDAPDVLTKMDQLSGELYQRQLIPIKDSLRYLRIESFSISTPFLTDNDLVAAIGILSVSERKARDQATYDKIMNVHTRFE